MMNRRTLFSGLAGFAAALVPFTLKADEEFRRTEFFEQAKSCLDTTTKQLGYHIFIWLGVADHLQVNGHKAFAFWRFDKAKQGAKNTIAMWDEFDILVCEVTPLGRRWSTRADWLRRNL